MEENEDEDKEKEGLILSLQNKKTYSDHDKIAIEFRWLDAQEEYEEEIFVVNFIESWQNKLMIKNLFKVTKWLFDDFSIVLNEREIKKIF